MGDRVAELLQQLAKISPMPRDEEQTEEVLNAYGGIVSELRQYQDPRCIEPLIAAFGCGYAFDGYWGAVHLLEKFPAEQVDPAIIRSFPKCGPGTRMWGAFMLGRGRNPASVPDLIPLLDDPEPLVREYAVVALAMIGDRSARPHLERLRNDASPAVRKEAEDALADLG